MTILEKTKFYVFDLFDFFLVVNNNKKWKYVVDNIIFRIVIHDYTQIFFETTIRRKLLICLLFSRKQQKKGKYVADNIIFGTSYPINLWQSLKTNIYVYNFLIPF